MLLDFKKIISLPVKNESGEYLGQIIDLEININDYCVTKFIVKHKFGIFESNELLISPTQIVKISDSEIIVKDLNVKESPAFKLKKVVLPEDGIVVQAKTEN